MKFEAVILALAILCVAAAPAPAHEVRIGDITVSHPWARASIGKAKNGAVYLAIRNDGQEADRLVGASTPVARKATLHTHDMQGEIMKMRHVKVIDVARGAPTVLAPGGLHIMLMGLTAPLKEGEAFPLTLTFERAGPVEITVGVQKPGAMAPGHEHESRAPPARGDILAGRLSCRAPVHVTEAAERQPGGALYEGPATKHHALHGIWETRHTINA